MDPNEELRLVEHWCQFCGGISQIDSLVWESATVHSVKQCRVTVKSPTGTLFAFCLWRCGARTASAWYSIVSGPIETTFCFHFWEKCNLHLWNHLQQGVWLSPGSGCLILVTSYVRRRSQKPPEVTTWKPDFSAQTKEVWISEVLTPNGSAKAREPL